MIINWLQQLRDFSNKWRNKTEQIGPTQNSRAQEWKIFLRSIAVLQAVMIDKIKKVIKSFVGLKKMTTFVTANKHVTLKMTAECRDGGIGRRACLKHK